VGKFAAILILAASGRGQGVPVIALAEAQSPALGAPGFEVATIKPSKPGTPGNGVGFRGSQFIAVNTSFKDLLKFAFELHSRQIGGGPSWLDSDSFDIIAKPEGEGRPSGKQLEAMVQKLLADRFRLSFHLEEKELSVYAITVGKDRLRLKKSESTATFPTMTFRGLGILPAKNATIAEFAGVMQYVLDRPVIDRTGLSVRFDFELDWTPDETQFGGRAGNALSSSDPKAPPDLFTAMRDQLGLRLESTKAFVHVLAIDHVEKPLAN
jgi:uncharacterized protein (TIGR03435 family)